DADIWNTSTRGTTNRQATKIAVGAAYSHPCRGPPYPRRRRARLAPEPFGMTGGAVVVVVISIPSIRGGAGGAGVGQVIVRPAPHGHWLRMAVICPLSSPTVSVPFNTALRMRVSHGLPGALNACWKLRATGVEPLAATSLIVISRGSFAAYSLFARSPREM